MLMRSKTLFATTAVLLIAGVALAERGDDADRKSKNGHAEGTVDGVSVVVDYGRPNVKGRDIWGGLVPFDAVWRTGANEATAISFDQDVTVEGVAIAAGTYGLFTLPTEDGCTVIFNSVAEQWGAFDYDSSKDAGRVDVAYGEGEFVETFEISVGDDGVSLAWADRVISFGVQSGS